MLLLVLLTGMVNAQGSQEVLCHTERVTDAASFNIYTGRNDANNPIIWQHTIPAGILDRVVRVGLYIEAWDVDAPPVNDEHDRVFFNGYDLGLLEGYNDTWMTVEKTVPLAALKEGTNELRVMIDELGKDWKVTIRASELRFYCSSAQPDFSLGLSPETLTIRQGENADATVMLTALNDFDGTVALDVTGLPEGVGAALGLNPLNPAPMAQTGLHLSVAASVPVGRYSLTVRGVSGEIEHRADLQLTVETGSQPPIYNLVALASPDSGLPPLEVAFSVRSDGDEPPAGTVYTWLFGDGNGAEGRTLRHIYRKAGSYRAKLTATLPSGESRKAEKTIRVISPDSRIILNFSKDRALAGESLNLTINLQNPHDGDLRNLELSLPLDSALVWKRMLKGLSPSATDGSLIWQIPLLQARESLDLTMEIQVSEQAKTGMISQTAELKILGLAKPHMSDAARLEIVPVALELTKTVNRASAAAGEELLYGIRLVNPGFVDLPIKLEDHLPSQLELISATGPLTREQSGQSLSWQGGLPAGAELNWQIRTVVKADVFAGERLENTAQVNSEALSGTMHSNTVVTIIEGAGISENQVHLDHRAEIPQSDLGRLVRLRINLSNRSASSLINPRLSILLPSGFDYVPGSSLLNGAKTGDPQGRGRIVFVLASLGAGQSLTLQYQVVIGSSSRRGPNLCRAELRALDGTRKEVIRTADARINVSSTSLLFMCGLEGQVFLDRDGDGLYTMEDQALQGIDVLLSSGERAQSDAEGRFRFVDLYPGEFLVGINRAALDERFDLPRPMSKVVVLSDGLTDFVDLPVVFADQTGETLARIEGRVFYDKDRDGGFSAGSDPLTEAFTVLLDQRTLTRGQGGRFVFTRLEPGPHHLEIRSGGRSHHRDIHLKPGPQTMDFPLPFSGIRIRIQGEKK